MAIVSYSSYSKHKTYCNLNVYISKLYCLYNISLLVCRSVLSSSAKYTTNYQYEQKSEHSVFL